MESIENKVAFGMAFPPDHEMSLKLHGSPLPAGCLRVSVDGSINAAALLPVPIAGVMEKVEEAIGSHVAWPEHLIIYPTSVVCISRLITIYSQFLFMVCINIMCCLDIFTAGVYLLNYLQIKKKELLERKKSEFHKMQSLFAQAQSSDKVPKRYRLLYKHATTYMEVSGIPIQFPCDIEVFGVDKTIYVLHENLTALLKFEMLGQAIIATYML